MARAHPLDGAIPGEALTRPPRTMPYDRPSQFSDPAQAMDFVFKKVMEPKTAIRLLSMLEVGMPIEVIVETILSHGFGEGFINATMLPIMVGPLTVILWRMADAAGIKPTISTDKPVQLPNKVMLNDAEAKFSQQRLGRAEAAGTASYKDVTKNVVKTAKDQKSAVGFMSPMFGQPRK